MSEHDNATWAADGFFVLRHALRKPIWFFSAVTSGAAAYVFYQRMTAATVSTATSLVPSRANAFPELLHPFDGGVFGVLVRACVLLTLAAVLGGSWFTYLVRNDFKPSNLLRFATNGFPLVAFFGLAGVLSILTAGGITWFNTILALPALVVALYAGQGLFTQKQRELVPVTATGDMGDRNASQQPAYPAVRSNKTFDFIVGMPDLKARLLKAGQEIKSRESGARNGILLSGEPGNGKTVLAEALAGELKLPLLSVSYGDVASKWINQTTEQVVAVFTAARAQAPCVLFIDEIDSLISSRDGNSTGFEESARTTNAILTEIVKLRGSGVVFMAATNYLDKLDAAAIREGRFDYKIEVPAPDQEAREAIVAASFTKHAPRGAAIGKGALSRAAKRWSGFSASRMSAVGQEAASKVQAGESVSFENLMQAMRVIQGRAGKVADDVPLLNDLSLTMEMRAPLKQLALRMQNITEIEEMGGSVPRGVLFRGPAGTGKTLTAQSLAKTAGWGFLSAAGSDLVRDPTKIEKLFRDAAEIRPCVIFLDESDDLLQNRDYSANPDATNKFLTVMDGAGGKTPDVMIIAATNYPERLDPATLRGGRFTEKIDFAVSDESQAAALAANWLAKLRLPTEPALSKDVLVKLLRGHSPANINAALQLAVDNVAARSLTGGKKVITMNDVKQALSNVS